MTWGNSSEYNDLFLLAQAFAFAPEEGVVYMVVCLVLCFWSKVLYCGKYTSYLYPVYCVYIYNLLGVPENMHSLMRW